MQTRILDTTEFPALGSRRAKRLSEQLQAIFEAYTNLPENLKRNAFVGMYSNGQVTLDLYGLSVWGLDSTFGKYILAAFSRETIGDMISSQDLKWSAFVAELKQALDIVDGGLIPWEQATEMIRAWKSQNEPGHEVD